MSILEKTTNAFLCIYRSVMCPQSNADHLVGKVIWIVGLFCSSYWLWQFDVLLWPGKQLITIFAGSSEPSEAQVAFFSGLAFITLFVLFVFALFAVSLLAEKSPSELLSTKRKVFFSIVQWLCVGSTVASLSYAAFVLGFWALQRAARWDVWAQSVVFALIGIPVSMLLHYLIKYWNIGKPKKYTLDGPFKPSKASSLTALFVAVWYSYLCIYPLMIHGAYSNLQTAYERCNVFNDAVRADPFLPVDQFQENDASQAASSGVYKASTKELELLHRFFKYTGIVKATTSFEDFQSDLRFSEDVPYFFQRDIVEGGNLSNPVYMPSSLLGDNFTSVKLASTLAYRKGGNTIHATNKGEKLAKCVAANLSGAPNCESDWMQLNSVDNNVRYGIFELRPIGIPTAVSDSDIVRQLLKVTLVDKNNRGDLSKQDRTLSELIETLRTTSDRLVTLKAGNPQNQSEIAETERTFADAKQEYAAWNFFSSPENDTIAARILEETLARTHSTPQVKAARYIVALVQGAEQLGMLILGVWLACLLVVRCRNMFKLARMKEWLKIAKPDSSRSMNADEVTAYVTRLFALESADNETVHEDVETRFERIRRVNFEGRWMMRWIAQALPAVGFIGTVRGIAAGLGSADTIVRAENVIGQAAAINLVAGSLGVAFTTTLIALVFGLALGILERLEASIENGMLSRLETACVIGSGAQRGD